MRYQFIKRANKINTVLSDFSVITRAMHTQKRCLNIEDMNPNIKALEYAVRGPLVTRAGEIEKELEQGVKKPFKEVIKAHNGDCHANGQVPITFIREVLALISYPALLNSGRFKDDVKEKARSILKICNGGSVGSYTDSAGIVGIRKHCAEFIQKRDGIPADWQNIVLSSGATDGIRNILKFMNGGKGKRSGVLIPIPQYPLYTATLAEFGMGPLGYYLDESRDWSLDISELERAYSEGSKNFQPIALVVINPGNPTGQVLPKQNIEEIIKFAHEKKLFLMADEVYQDNIYNSASKFYSFKKVMMEMGEPYDKIELASFMSVSKGYMGECGLRGGYTEFINICPQVRAMYSVAISAMLCPSVLGQATIDCVVKPPLKGDSSYDLWKQETDGIFNSLKLRAKLTEEAFKSMEGFKCNPIQGAMYCFPQFTLPQKAIDAAKAAGQAPDVFYAFQLLENTGICVVAGSGFGQMPGTYHFRITILPQLEKLKTMLTIFKEFHESFLRKYK